MLVQCPPTHLSHVGVTITGNVFNTQKRPPPPPPPPPPIVLPPIYLPDAEARWHNERMRADDMEAKFAFLKEVREREAKEGGNNASTTQSDWLNRLRYHLHPSLSILLYKIMTMMFPCVCYTLHTPYTHPTHTLHTPYTHPTHTLHTYTQKDKHTHTHTRTSEDVPSKR